MEEKYIGRFKRIKLFFFIALAAIPLFAGSLFLGRTEGPGFILQVVSACLILPFTVYTYCITILHWKDRYQGAYSDLWGILLIIETSGWFKIIYFFRHMLPDARSTGRYRNRPVRT